MSQLNFHYSATGSWEVTSEKCQSNCDQKGGTCSSCAKGGFCCRNYEARNENCPLNAMQAASMDHHTCVQLKQGSKLC